jgi:hydroxyacylglutathione hydrolase
VLFRQIYDDSLAQAAYLIGCQRTGEAVVIDPERDVDRYIALAKKEGLRIVAVAETHIHADFLSGARELAEKTGATVYLSGTGGPDWTSGWLDAKSGGGSYNHRVVADGDVFHVGNIDFTALHTPGHTPEHLCYLVTDRGSGADEPMGILSGDFLFVGDVGRPDLLETAAGQTGSKEASAEDLFATMRVMEHMPDYLQVWPAHGAGSACGKALGAVPQSTIGYEKRFSPALQVMGSHEKFIAYVLEGQPEPPLYFARMKRQNRDGVPLLGDLPTPRELDAKALAALDTEEVVVIDLRSWAAYRDGHLPGALWSPLNSQLAMSIGSYVEPEERIALVVEPTRLEDAIRALVRIGLDRVESWASPHTMQQAAHDAPERIRRTKEITAEALAAGAPGPILDVRRAEEHRAGRIDGATNIAHTRLKERITEVPSADGAPIVVHCHSGVRSGCATAFLEREGYEVANLAGGWVAWQKAQQKVAQ